MNDVSICRWGDLANRVEARRTIDDIFFESSATKSFADADTRAAFNERWLGRYIAHYPENFFVAVAREDADRAPVIAGYLAGCVQDVRQTHYFSDISYFDTFSAHLDAYRAHLHVNLAPQFRSQGLGQRLVAAFFDDVRAAGLGGVHVVTGRASRNVAFYERCGFAIVDTAEFNGGVSAFLGARV